MQAHIDQEESKRDANREPKDKTITTTISQPKSVPKKKAFVPPIRKRLSNMLETAMQKQYDAVAQQKKRAAAIVQSTAYCQSIIRQDHGFQRNGRN